MSQYPFNIVGYGYGNLSLDQNHVSDTLTLKNLKIIILYK